MPRKKPTGDTPARQDVTVPVAGMAALVLPGVVRGVADSPATRAARTWLDGGPSPLRDPDAQTGEGNYTAVRDAAGVELARRVLAHLGVAVDALVPTLAEHDGARMLMRAGEAGESPTFFLQMIAAPILRPDATPEDRAAVARVAPPYAVAHALFDAAGDAWHAAGCPEPFDVDRFMPPVPDTIPAAMRPGIRRTVAGLAERMHEHTRMLRALIARSAEDEVGAFMPWPPAAVRAASGATYGDEVRALGAGTLYALPTTDALDLLTAHVDGFAHAMEDAKAAGRRAFMDDAGAAALVDAVAPSWPFRRDDPHGAGARSWLLVTGLHALWAQERMRAAEEGTAAARADVDALRRELTRTRKKLERLTLPPRTTLPHAMLASGYTKRLPARVHARIKRKEWQLLDESHAEAVQSWRDAAASTAPAQLATLTSPEIRALFTAYRVFSTLRNEGGQLVGPAVEVPASELWKLAGATMHTARERLFNGLVSVSRRMLPVALEKDGAVLGDMVRLVEMRPIWRPTEDGRRALSREDVERAKAAWMAHTDGARWTGPLPTHVLLDVPPVLRGMFKPVVFAGDVLEKLDAGAKAMRGRGEGFAELDAFLLVCLMLTAQRGMLSPREDGRVLAYVDPAELLRDFYGPDRIAEWRRRGKLKERAGAQYEKAVAVLDAGGLARRDATGHARADGGDPCDVFALNPDVFVSATPNRKAKVAALAHPSLFTENDA